MRTTIDIHDGWIFLRRVEVGRKHQAIVEVGHTVSSLDGSHFHFWHGELSPRLLDVIVFVAQGTICSNHFVTACHLWRRPRVHHVGAIGVEAWCVPSLLVAEQRALAFHVHAVDGATNRVCLIACVENRFVLFVESSHVNHFKLSFGELTLQLCLRSFQGIKIYVVVAILARLINESGRIPRQELNRVERLEILAVVLLEERAEQLARCSVVCVEMTVVLVAIHFDEVERLGIGTPSDICEIAVGRVACFQIDGLARLYVVDANAHLMTGLASHWVWVGVELRSPRRTFCTCANCGFRDGDVHLRISTHHRLIHAIERKERAVGTPESALADAEFIAMYTAAVSQCQCAIVAHGSRLSFCVRHVEVMVFHESEIP